MVFNGMCKGKAGAESKVWGQRQVERQVAKELRGQTPGTEREGRRTEGSERWPHDKDTWAGWWAAEGRVLGSGRTQDVEGAEEGQGRDLPENSQGQDLEGKERNCRRWARQEASW